MVLLHSTVGSAQKVDTLVMNNGDVITGELKELFHGKLAYKTDDMGTLSVKWSKIFKLVSRNYYEVEMSSGLRYFGSLDWPEDSRQLVVVLTTADTLPMGQVVAINRIRSTFLARTNGYFDLGLNITRANRQSEWSVGLEGNYRGPKWGATLVGSSYFRFQNDTASNTSRNSASLSASRFLKRKSSIAVSFAVEQNAETNLDLRTTTGGGVGYAVIRSNSMTLDLSGSLVGTNEKYSTSPDATQSLELQFIGDWQVFRFDSPKLDLQSTLQLFPSLTDIGRVRTQWDYRLSYELISDFFVGFKGFVSYDNRPPTTDAVKLDYRANFTIGWSWS